LAALAGVEEIGMQKRLAILVVSFLSGAALAPPASAAPLVAPRVPELDVGAGIIKDKAAAIALGKALFWDEQAGSDGMACASCHFSAGADNRTRNQLSPGFLDAAFAGVGGDTKFGSTRSDTGAVSPGKMPSGAVADSNYDLKAADFPLHQLEDYKDRNSRLITTTNDVVSSSGAYSTEFNRVKRFGKKDNCTKADGSIFHAGRFPARQVEPRNTPTTINAAFFHSNFWDGRANNLFNGVGVFGLRDIEGDPNKRLIVLDSANVPQLSYLQIRNASLASQAVGPPLSALEMSCDGRTFADVGRKMLTAIPLRGQSVSMADSVLGTYVSASGKGLKPQHLYAVMVARAFEPKYWAAPGKFKIVGGMLKKDPKGYSQMEMNFSMFWGISIMMYEQTLISDQSRFDTWFASCRPAATNPSGLTVPIGNPVVTCLPAADNPNQSTDPVAHGLTAQEVLGFGLFNNGGTGIRNAGNTSCAGCHGPLANPRTAPTTADVILPVMSEAAFTSGQTAAFNPVERSLIVELGDGIPPIPNTFPAIPITDQRAGAMHDRGFFNIGVTPASVDPGNGGLDAYGNPLSLSRMFLKQQAGLAVVDPALLITPATAETPTVTAPINRCNSPGVIEPGGTPGFVGCTDPANPTLLDITQEREVVDGGFKTPSLRNVGLTAPYFHSGNYGDLRSLVQFYARGGSRRSMSIDHPGATGDTSGTGPLGKGPVVHGGPDYGTNVDFFIRDIKSTDEQIDAMVAFMLTLTDPRVQCDAAPFDHPALTIRNGHAVADKKPKDGKADDLAVTLPAVGATGYAHSSGYCLPNKGDLFAPGMQGRVGGQRLPLY
jgi:cytochrome c peroxidase